MDTGAHMNIQGVGFRGIICQMMESQMDKQMENELENRAT